MKEKEYQDAFNELIRYISELLEATGNYNLVRVVKKRLYDFSDKIKETEHELPEHEENSN